MMLTVRQVSERLNRHEVTIRRMIQDGRLRAYRSPTGTIGIPEEAVTEYEAKHDEWLPIVPEPAA